MQESCIFFFFLISAASGFQNPISLSTSELTGASLSADCGVSFQFLAEAGRDCGWPVSEGVCAALGCGQGPRGGLRCSCDRWSVSRFLSPAGPLWPLAFCGGSELGCEAAASSAALGHFLRLACHQGHRQGTGLLAGRAPGAGRAADAQRSTCSCCAVHRGLGPTSPLPRQLQAHFPASPSARPGTTWVKSGQRQRLPVSRRGRWV